MKKLFTYLFIITAAFTQQAHAQQAGSLDTKFNTTGYNVNVVNGHDNEVYTMALQSDGKVVAAGYILYGDSEEIKVVRYNTDGTLDNTFNGTGTLNFYTGLSTEADAITIQSDGKILIGGFTVINYATYNDFLVLRLNANGTVDNTFGNNGVAVTDIYGYNDIVYSLAIQPDGKIVAAGASNNGSTFVFTLARYTAAGVLDSSFNGTGIVTTQVSDLDNMVLGVALQADGKIVAGGYTHLLGIGADYFAVCRYATDGLLDTSFNSTGIVITDISGFDNGANALAIQPDGKTILCGNASNDNGAYSFALARYNTNGHLDTTFNGTGKVITGFNCFDAEARSVKIQPDGKIIAAGYADNGTSATYQFALARYNSNGSPDATFGTGGLVSTNIGGIDDEAFAGALQADGKFVAGGASESSFNHNFVVARYLTSGSAGVLNFNTPVNQYLIYPNPATTNTQLEYELQNTETISVAVFDVTGKLVSAVFNNQTQTAGKHSVTIPFARQLAAGTYFVRITNSTGQVSIKMVKG